MKLSLYTMGEGSSLKFVTSVETPPFLKEPEVIFWGQRCFVRQFVAGDSSYHYVEGLVWLAPLPGVPDPAEAQKSDAVEP